MRDMRIFRKIPMSQKIKKQIRRSMPWLLIFSLIISSAAVGLVFNFNINVYQKDKDNVGVKFDLSTAQAQNTTATTSVTVRNAPPSFTAGPAESNPVSTTTTPVNTGSSIAFTGTASDDEGNHYYLAICSSNSIIASTTGGAPSCAAGHEFCISTSTAETKEATCASSTVINAAETDEWWGFACDDHATEGECTVTGSQGSTWPHGDSASPFYINHAPTLNSATTSINFQIPGGQFEFTATSTDTDTARGGDGQDLYICDNAGWTAGVGCTGVTYCVGQATSTNGAAVAISCTWDDTAPTADTDYPVWVYVEDQYDMAASGNGLQITYTVINVAPVVDDVYLVPNLVTEISLNIKDAGGTVVTASTTNVTDQNGCGDLVSATSTIYWSVAPNGSSCSANDNRCYQIGSGACAIENCVGAIAEVTCTTTIRYHAIPTDASSYYATTTWHAAISVSDEALSHASSTDPGTDIRTNFAQEVDENYIQYGSITAGQNTGTNTATTTVTNFGNSPIDTYLYGTDMSKAPDIIEINNQEHDLTAYFNWSTGTDATSTPSQNLEDLDAARPTTIAADVVDYVYWGIGIPSGRPSGLYEGLNTFQVTIDPNGSWGS